MQVSTLKQHKNISKTIFTPISLGLCLGAASFSAQAIQQGDMFMRFTATQVAPNNDSTTLDTTFVYMVSNNLGFEVLAALPFEHDITVEGMGKVGSTKQLPPTVSIQYYFNPEKISPLVWVWA